MTPFRNKGDAFIDNFCGIFSKEFFIDTKIKKAHNKMLYAQKNEERGRDNYCSTITAIPLGITVKVAFSPLNFLAILTAVSISGA